MDANASAWTGSVHAMDAKGFGETTKGVLKHSILTSFIALAWRSYGVFGALRGLGCDREVLFWSYLSFLCRSSFSLLSLLKTISRSLLLRLQ
jgi:hypothetical protein